MAIIKCQEMVLFTGDAIKRASIAQFTMYSVKEEEHSVSFV